MVRKKEIRLKEPRLSRAAFHRRAMEFLARIQPSLLPEHAHDVVAINMKTGEYVLGADSHEAHELYRSRWPDVLAYVCRANGEASTKFRGI